MENLMNYSHQLMVFEEKIGDTPEMLRANFVWADAVTIAGKLEVDRSMANKLYVPDPDLMEQNPPEFLVEKELRITYGKILESRIAELELLVKVLEMSGV
jgi:hypothetical protein